MSSPQTVKGLISAGSNGGCTDADPPQIVVYNDSSASAQNLKRTAFSEPGKRRARLLRAASTIGTVGSRFGLATVGSKATS